MLLLSACTGSVPSVEQSAAPASRAQVVSAPVDDFVGTWEGVYYSYPHAMGLTLSLTATGKTDVEGQARFYPLDSNSRTLPRPAQGSFSVRGTYDPTLRTFNLSPGDWDERPPQGGRPFALTGVFDPGQPALAGLFAGQRLDHYYTLTRPEQAHHLTGPIQGRPTQRAGGRVPSDDALVAWASRLNAEYPDIDPRRTQMGQLYTVAVNLFADGHFSTFFGTTFDQMSARQRDAVQQRFARTSRISTSRPGTLGRLIERQPNEELREFSALGRAFSASGTQSAPHVVNVVLAQRVIRAWHADQQARISDLAPTVGAFADLDRLASVGEENLRTLWPSEQASFQDAIAGTREPLANDILEAQIATIEAMEPTYNTITSLLELRNDLGPIYQLAGSEIRRKFDGQVRNRIAAVLSKLLPDEERKVDRVSLSMAGIEDLNGLFRDFDRRYSMLRGFEMVDGAYEKFHRKKEEILTANAAQIAGQIEGASNVDEIQDLESRYFVALRSESREVVDVRRQLTQRKDAIVAAERQQRIEAQRAALQRAQAALAAEHAELAAENAKLTPQSFSARGLHNEALLTRLYKGEFVDINLERDDTRFALLYSAYLNSYARQCPGHLPANRVEMTRQECRSWIVTRNQWGAEVSRRCTSWETVGTGLYADPEMYRAKHELDVLQVGDAFRQAVGILAGSDPVGTMFGMAGDVTTITRDMDALFRANACDGPELRRFQDNLRLFALNKRPRRLDGGGILSPVVTPPPGTLFEDQNYARLIEDLVYHQSRSWAMNRYQRGSVSNVSVSSRDALDRPTRITADYVYTGIRGGTRGSVTLTFEEGWPHCLYFYDNRVACRSPNRGIIDAYANGAYGK